MSKTLLSIALIATQVLAWNASPLYLCLDPDGSICLDFGPQSCHCCADEAGQADACHEDGACHHDHACADERPSDAAGPACPCKHVQISEPQTATIVRATVLPDMHQLVIPLVAEPSPSAGISLDSHRAAPLESPEAASFTLAELSSVVMRC